MKILFDQGTPVPLRRFLTSHIVSTVYELGWSKFENGDILTNAEENGFEVFVTTDKNIQYQQNLSYRTIAIVVLSSTSWPRIEKVIPDVVRNIDTSSPGGFIEVEIP